MNFKDIYESSQSINMTDSLRDFCNSLTDLTDLVDTTCMSSFRICEADNTKNNDEEDYQLARVALDTLIKDAEVSLEKIDTFVSHIEALKKENKDWHFNLENATFTLSTIKNRLTSLQNSLTMLGNKVSKITVRVNKAIETVNDLTMHGKKVPPGRLPVLPKIIKK
jgi:chromosome segregation ATPase